MTAHAQDRRPLADKPVNIAEAEHEQARNLLAGALQGMDELMARAADLDRLLWAGHATTTAAELFAALDATARGSRVTELDRVQALGDLCALVVRKATEAREHARASSVAERVGGARS